ncbi:MAG: hypothetical protein PV362_08945 [Providencia heimbachae]|nr:hypothetical protein [Providencia heimbachae]
MKIEKPSKAIQSFHKKKGAGSRAAASSVVRDPAARGFFGPGAPNLAAVTIRVRIIGSMQGFFATPRAIVAWAACVVFLVFAWPPMRFAVARSSPAGLIISVVFAKFLQGTPPERPHHARGHYSDFLLGLLANGKINVKEC